MRGGSSIFEPSTGPKVLFVPRRPVPKGLGENAFFARLRPVGASNKVRARAGGQIALSLRCTNVPHVKRGGCAQYVCAPSFSRYKITVGSAPYSRSSTLINEALSELQSIQRIHCD